MLLLGLLAFPATASAYSGNDGHSPVAPQRSQLSAFVVGQAGSSSVEVRVSGYGFRSGEMFLSATEGGQSVSIQPTVVRTNRNGSFSEVVRIQLPFNVSRQQSFRQLYQLHPTQIVLHATGRFGQSATSVLFLGQANQGFQYGLIR
jgi:hypothetical protein